MTDLLDIVRQRDNERHACQQRFEAAVVAAHRAGHSVREIAACSSLAKSRIHGIVKEGSAAEPDAGVRALGEVAATPAETRDEAWREAIGAVPRPPGAPRAEEVIRKLRDGSDAPPRKQPKGKHPGQRWTGYAWVDE